MASSVPITSASARNPGDSPGQSLARQLTPGRRLADLTSLIAACACSEPVRAGLYLMNSDWEQAHQTAQDVETPVGAHWHALVHRHEPDLSNSKYWLGRVGQSPIYSALAQAAIAAGHDEVAPRGRWNAARFADCFADPQQAAWTRDLDALELRLLLEFCLEHDREHAAKG